MTGSTQKIILTALLVGLAGWEQPDDTQNQASVVPGNLSANAKGNAMSPPVQTSSENSSGNDSAQQKEPVLPPSTADLRFVGSWASEERFCDGNAWEFTKTSLHTPAGSVCEFTKVSSVSGGYDIDARCTAEGPPVNDKLKKIGRESCRERVGQKV